MIKLLAVLFTIMIFALGFGVSWGIVVGLIKLITICFGLDFSLLTATGIWLVICLIHIVVKGLQKKESD